jgi:hypothetical protein
MGKAETVETPGAQLSPVGVHRQLAIAGDAMTAVDEQMGFTLAAETQTFQPGQGQERESVIELNSVNILGLVVSALPEILASLVGGRPFHLIPTVAVDRA